MKIHQTALTLVFGLSLAACGATTPAPTAAQDTAQAGKLTALTSPAANNAVCFYTDANYQGKSYCVALPASGGKTQVAYVGDEFNDTFSSLKLKRGLTVTVNWDSNFGGGAKQFYADVPDLEATPGFSWGSGIVRLNDAISSFSVGR